MEKVKENYWKYEQRPAEYRPCPKCKEPMRTEFSSLVMTSNPPQQRWYWECWCGYQELGGIHRRSYVKHNVAI
jgi:hypothetical protein